MYAILLLGDQDESQAADKVICVHHGVGDRAITIEPGGPIFGFTVYLSDRSGNRIEAQKIPDAKVTSLLEESADWNLMPFVTEEERWNAKFGMTQRELEEEHAHYLEMTEL